MKNVDLETMLLAARPIVNNEHSQFTDVVMQKIKQQETFSKVLRKTNMQNERRMFMRFIKLHRVLAVFVLIMVITSISFTGYAYAIGSNPVSLIRRWVTGDQVNVEYDGRTFQHGTKRTYNDAAITAYAELNTVSGLYFKASNAFQVPQNGIEHVSNPADTAYVYPWVGTVERVDKSNVYIRKQYTIGDKMRPSTSDDQLVTLAKQRTRLFRKGEHAHEAYETGKVVEVFQEAYLEHTIGSKSAPAPIKQFFVFELTHTLDQVKEADQGNQAGHKAEDGSERGLFEPSWGGFSNICLNNGADICDNQGNTEVESLYDLGVSRQGNIDIGTYIQSNPNVIPFGEGVSDESNRPKDLILRNTQGAITEITPSNIVIKSSSGIHWTLAYTSNQQKDFSKRHKPLKIGDKLTVSVIGSINDLDSRQFDNRHVYFMQRY